MSSLGSETLMLEVTQGDVSIDSEQIESAITPYYDLMGLPVAHPTRGIYIKEGKKVVIGK